MIERKAVLTGAVEFRELITGALECIERARQLKSADTSGTRKLYCEVFMLAAPEDAEFGM
jgi:hypothetical protein